MTCFARPAKRRRQPLRLFAAVAALAAAGLLATIAPTERQAPSAADTIPAAVGYRIIAMINAHGMTPMITLWLTPGWANGNRGEPGPVLPCEDLGAVLLALLPLNSPDELRPTFAHIGHLRAVTVQVDQKRRGRSPSPVVTRVHEDLVYPGVHQIPTITLRKTHTWLRSGPLWSRGRPLAD
jgi:hypothetical protein